MAKWSDCAICGRAIPVGELCYGIKNWRGEPSNGDTICSDCLVPENAPTLTQPNEWISTDKCTPEPMKDVLVMFENGIMCVGFTYYDYRLLNRWSIHIDHALYQPCPINPKYWTLLPKPPKEELRNETNRCR